MKPDTIITISFLLLFEITACRNNSLKTDENLLAKKILSEENKLSQGKIDRPDLTGNENTNTASFRLREIRKVNPSGPPVRIDLPGENIKAGRLKLSELASSVTYIKLQTPPDTLLTYDPHFSRNELISTVRIDGNLIIFHGPFGLTRFNMKGEYLETIWKNETGIEIRGSGVMWRPQDFFGVMPNNPISLINGNLYYSFTDGPAGIGLILNYKFKNDIPFSMKREKEVPGRRTIRGDTIFITTEKVMERFDVVAGTGPDNWAGINRKWNSGKSGTLLVTFNDKGDTLCKFTDNEKIINFSKPNYRMASQMVSYYYKNQLTIKHEYNDTVFRLIPPERLLPAYILSFGDKGVKFMDGLNPDYDLSEKLILNAFIETDNFLLIRYTQNNDSPNNRRKGSVKYFNVKYDKRSGRITYQSSPSQNPEPIENDIDYGIPFWPDITSSDGRLVQLVSGKIMRDYIYSEDFKNSSVPGEKREKLLSMTSQMKPTDMIIMIVK